MEYDAQHSSCSRIDTSVQFSVVIPIYNRADFLTACIDSVLAQTLRDYEIILVDDGSTDQSSMIANRYVQDNVRFVQHLANQGVCSARATGTHAAEGNWLLFLDTDWTLKPNCLQAMAHLAKQAPANTGVLGLSCLDEHDNRIPDPQPPLGLVTYTDYLQWLNPPMQSDYLYAIHKRVFNDVSWPTDRRLEAQFHLKVAAKWDMYFSSNIGAIVSYSAPNRYSTNKAVDQAARRLQMAKDQFASRHEILSEFGADIRLHAPKWYIALLRGAGLSAFLSGDRARGLIYTFRHLSLRPWSLKGWAQIALGMISPAALLWGQRRFGR